VSYDKKIGLILSLLLCDKFMQYIQHKFSAVRHKFTYALSCVRSHKNVRLVHKYPYRYLLFVSKVLFTPGTRSGANPTIVSYNASAVKIYNAMSGLVHFENKNIIIYVH
jgi:hypothetical protein